MERFVTIVNGFHSLIIIAKRSILDVAAVLDTPLIMSLKLNVPQTEQIFLMKDEFGITKSK